MKTTHVHFSSYLSQFVLEEDMFRKKVVEKTETHFILNILFFANSAVYEIM